MAKQEFSVGQVLTSAQMSALQLNDYNQTVSTKVASYTLVAADAGTRIVMNAGATDTTITVNTSLFSAGDTLEILNTSTSGICTITAGTATVSTSSTLRLTLNAGGKLYFTSTGVAVFQSYDTPGMTLLSTTSLSGASVTVFSIPQTFKNLYIEVLGMTNATADGVIAIQLNQLNFGYLTGVDRGTAFAYNGSAFKTNNNVTRTNADNGFILLVTNYASSTTGNIKPCQMFGFYASPDSSFNGAGMNYGSAAITSVTASNSGGNMLTGTMKIYGVN